jgi:hypothetical protein
VTAAGKQNSTVFHMSLQVWNSDTSEEARKGIQSDLVSDEPEMRLLYTTPGEALASTAHVLVPYMVVTACMHERVLL